MCDQVLKVDITGRPVEFIPWWDYVRLHYLGKATILAVEEDEFWHSPSTAVPKAAVIQVADYVKLKPLKDTHVPKRILFARDDWTCQYCGVKVNLKTGTKDHVIPRSRRKELGMSNRACNSWENLTTACRPCNEDKGNFLPREIGMFPKHAPRKPEYVQVRFDKVYSPIQADYVAAYYQLQGPDKEAIEVITQ